MENTNKAKLKPAEPLVITAHLREQSGPDAIKGYHNPFRTLLIIAALVFAAELFVMFVLYILPSLSVMVEAFVDAFMLTILLFPFLYIFLFRPLLLQITERKQAEKELSKHREHLEDLVQERTNELQKNNEQLQQEITEREKTKEVMEVLNKELAKTVEKLTVANRELAEFTRVAAHDLKAPLRAIGTLADWISTDYADKFDKQGKERVRLLVGRAERMSKLIDSILWYSGIGRAARREEKVNLNVLIEEVIAEIAPPDSIEVAVENELPIVMCERTHIMTVFQNLVGNAVKYMDKPKGQVRVGCVEDDSFWKFSVTDNGLGIAEEHLERIFQIFQTLLPRDKFESTGIGLTVVKKIVELYGGKIWVQSKPGEGSTFFFTLPKQEMGVKDAKLEANIAC